MHDAVIFDLFGTLIPSASTEERDAISFELAELLGVDGLAFADIVRATFDERMRGELGGLRETYSTLAERLGGSPDPDQLSQAIQRRLEFSHQLLGVQEAAPVLRTLQEAGIKVGVVTDCSIETPEIWEATWLHGAVGAVSFSCFLGSRKPDARNYLVVTEQLDVEPSACLYVGDGGSQELSGARNLGMAAVLLEDPREVGRDRPDEERDWLGPRISSIHQVLELVNS
jgi:putative hydrolase of the HAD superfamily